MPKELRDCENSAPKVFIKTFGCQMNEYDSCRILKLLESCGYKSAPSYEDASVILLNTCTVRKKAEDKVYSALGRIKKIKNSRPDLTIAVGGCLAQQEAQNLIKRFPYVDLVFGTKALPRLPSLLESAKNGKKIVDVEMNSSREIYSGNSYSPAPCQVTAFVTIMQGCNNFCSYCIVPYVRGSEWSRLPSEIIKEVTHLAESGIKEVTLLGQNVNSYGKTLTPKATFSELLTELNSIDGLERIRFITSHPKDLSGELILSFKRLEKLCEHIHLPLQSGSNRILKKMNRVYTREEYLEKISSLREIVPDIVITSDIIVGFPGETENDFNKTLSMIEEICFDDLFLFHYTDRPGTKASKISAKIPYKTKIERLNILNDRQREISLKNNNRLAGETFSVLFEGTSKKGFGDIAGRTRTNKVVNCKGPSELIGKTALVKVGKANIHSLTGKLI